MTIYDVLANLSHAVTSQEVIGTHVARVTVFDVDLLHATIDRVSRLLQRPVQCYAFEGYCLLQLGSDA